MRFSDLPRGLPGTPDTADEPPRALWNDPAAVSAHHDLLAALAGVVWAWARHSIASKGNVLRDMPRDSCRNGYPGEPEVAAVGC